VPDQPDPACPGQLAEPGKVPLQYRQVLRAIRDLLVDPFLCLLGREPVGADQVAFHVRAVGVLALPGSVVLVRDQRHAFGRGKLFLERGRALG
jgi:hypothetical protein